MTMGRIMLSCFGHGLVDKSRLENLRNLLRHCVLSLSYIYYYNKDRVVKNIINNPVEESKYLYLHSTPDLVHILWRMLKR